MTYKSPKNKKIKKYKETNKQITTSIQYYIA